MKTSKTKPSGDKRTASKEAAAVFPKDLDHYDNGLQQLMADVVGSFEVLREVFGRERGLQTQRNEFHDAKNQGAPESDWTSVANRALLNTR